MARQSSGRALVPSSGAGGHRADASLLPLPRRARRATSAPSMSSPPAIAVERLVKIYKTVPAVAGISFALAPGTITGLLGGNGAGKTTTIATIMGLVTP